MMEVDEQKVQGNICWASAWVKWEETMLGHNIPLPDTNMHLPRQSQTSSSGACIASSLGGQRFNLVWHGDEASLNLSSSAQVLSPDIISGTSLTQAAWTRTQFSEPISEPQYTYNKIGCFRICSIWTNAFTCIKWVQYCSSIFSLWHFRSTAQLMISSRLFKMLQMRGLMTTTNAAHGRL